MPKPKPHPRRKPFHFIADIRALARIAAGKAYYMGGQMPASDWERRHALLALKAVCDRDNPDRLAIYHRYCRAAGLNSPAQAAASRYLTRKGRTDD